ncbi:hypothetical protein MPER_15252 [Moniliophthora perniciosa FA553]|nr:hypothetical protein MPER_15252 [Moniliophthora perniciosa FA553]
MAMGSYTGSNNGSFNPASYTRRFLGSPISWRSGSYSFGGRHYAGSPMKDQIRGSLEQTVGTLEPQVQDALKVFDLQDEMTYLMPISVETLRVAVYTSRIFTPC